MTDLSPTAAATGRFVTFEGIDGAGKSSHVLALADWVRARGAACRVTREPGGTPLAERVRDAFLHEAMDPLTEALLMFAARRDHLRTVIEPALARGEVVICDRFSDASFAYQGGGRGFDWAVLAQLEVWVQAGLRPDLTLWFDLDPAEAARRRGAARDADRLEREDERFFERVRAGYARRAAAEPDRFVRIDAAQPIEAVRAEALAALAARGWFEAQARHG
jgi:dTMP kinase